MVQVLKNTVRNFYIECVAETRQLDEDRNTAMVTKTAGADPGHLLRLLEAK